MKEILIVGGGAAGMFAGIRAAQRGMRAVSYTHLDVYKRQVL